MHDQGTEEWYQARCGKVTASRVQEILPGKSGKYLKSREDYMLDKYIELRTNKPVERFEGNHYTEAGKYLEPAAIAAYEGLADAFVVPCGSIPHPTIERFSASPDGLIDEDGQAQVKCRFSPTGRRLHWWSIQNDAIPEKIVIQMQSELMCTGRAWNDFISYCPAMPEDEQIFIKRLAADPEQQAFIEEHVIRFWKDLHESMK